MASIKQRNNAYEICVSHGFDGNGKRLRHTCTWRPDPQKTKRQNEAALRRFVDDFERRVKDGTVRADELTFKAFAESWMQDYAAKHLEATTIEGYNHILRLRLYPRCGAMKLSEFRPLTVQRLLDDIRAEGYVRNGIHHTYSDESVRSTKIVLSSILSAAKEDGILTDNPCTRQRKRSKAAGPEEIKTFSAEEAVRFIEMLDTKIPVIVDERVHKRNGKLVTVQAHVNRSIIVQARYKVLFVTALYSGARRGELIALKWSDVDFARGAISIRRAAGYTGATGQYIKAPKTAAGYREIFLPPAAMEELHALKRGMQKSILRLGSAWDGPRDIQDNFVFAGDTGRMMAHSTPRKELHRILTAYNKAFPDKALPVLTFHQLRHTSASLLIASGLDPVATSQRLGHADTTTTLRIYAHSFEERDKAASDALERVLARRRA